MDAFARVVFVAFLEAKKLWHVRPCRFFNRVGVPHLDLFKLTKLVL